MGASFANRPRELVPRALPCSAWGFFLSSGFLLLLLVSRSSCLGVSFPPPGKYQSPPRFLPFPLPLGFLPPGFRLLLLVFLSLLLDFFFAFVFFLSSSINSSHLHAFFSLPGFLLLCKGFLSLYLAVTAAVVVAVAPVAIVLIDGGNEFLYY